MPWLLQRTVLPPCNGWVAEEVTMEVPGRLVTALSEKEFRMTFEVENCGK